MDPEVFVVLKDGDSHGTRSGTPLCVELDERTARYRKIGRCVRYVPATRVDELETAIKRLLDGNEAATKREAYFKGKLAEVAKGALKLRKKAETDGAACIAYFHVANEHLDKMLAVLVEAQVVQP